MTDRSRYQEGIIRRGYEHRDTIALQRLGEIVSDLYLASGGEANRLWSNAKAALDKVAADDPQAEKVLKERNVQALAQLLNVLVRESRQAAKSQAQQPPLPSSTAHPSNAIAEGEQAEHDATGLNAEKTHASQEATMTLREQMAAKAAADAAGAAADPEQLKRAMKAFRKRLKLKRLDEESRLGRGPLSHGKQAPKMAIMPPDDYPAQVWEALATQGKLKSRGGGFYELIE